MIRHIPAAPRKRFLMAALLLAVSGLLAGCAGSDDKAVGLPAQERSIVDTASDTGLSITVNQMLLQTDPRLFRKVGVEVVEGRVLLTGEVERPEQRIDATKVAWGVDGVREVINEIQVVDNTGVVSTAKDSWITTRLRSKLLGDRNVIDLNYNIETVNGVIYLIGIARSQKELELVTFYARSISGVEKVINHVWLKDDPRRKI